MSPVPSLTLPDGRTLGYATYGDPSGRPLVFHHGTPGCHELGALLDGPADAQGVHVIAPARQGSGLSEPAPDAGIRDWVRDCEALLDHLDIETAALAGFSGGCPFAAAVGAAVPDRVTRLDLVGGPVPATDSDPFGPLTATPRLLGGVLRGVGWLAARTGPDTVTANLTDRDLPDSVARTVSLDFRRAVAGGAAGPVRETRVLAGDWTLPDPAVPTRVSHGSEDENVPIDAVRAHWSGRDGVQVRALDTDHLGSLLEARRRVLETVGEPDGLSR